MRRYLTTDNLLRYLLLLVAVLPLFIFRDFTRNNELRYLTIADEAIRDGHIFAFYNQGAAYADKPPLYLWFIMLGKILFGKHSLVFLGIFSMIPALVILWVMNRWTRKWFENDAQRSATQLMLFTSAFFFLCAAMVRMDMLMCLFIVLALWTFYRLYSGEDSGHIGRNRILFAVWIFLGVFTKGPMGILIPLISTIVFLLVKREWRKIGYYWGWLTWGILIGLCGIWFTGVYLDGGAEYLDNLVFKQTAGRVVDAYHHKEPFWFYGISIWYSLAPWVLLVVGILIAGIVKWRKMGLTDPERFFLTVGLSTLTMLSLISGKVDIYLLPALPFFIYLAGLWLRKMGEKRWMSWAVGIPAGILLLPIPVLIAEGEWSALYKDSLWTMVSVAVLTLTGVACLICLFGGKLIRGIRVLAYGMLLMIFTGSFALPAYNDLIGLGNVARAAKTAGDQMGGKVEYYSYGISRGENMEAYIGKDLQVYEWMQELPKIAGPAVLISRSRMVDTTDHRSSRELIRRIEGLDRHEIGPWFYVVVPGSGKEAEL